MLGDSYGHLKSLKVEEHGTWFSLKSCYLKGFKTAPKDEYRASMGLVKTASPQHAMRPLACCGKPHQIPMGIARHLHTFKNLLPDTTYSLSVREPPGPQQLPGIWDHTGTQGLAARSHPTTPSRSSTAGGHPGCPRPRHQAPPWGWTGTLAHRWSWLSGAHGWAGLWGAGGQCCCCVTGAGTDGPRGADMRFWSMGKVRGMPGGLAGTVGAGRASWPQHLQTPVNPEAEMLCIAAAVFAAVPSVVHLLPRNLLLIFTTLGEVSPV